MVPPTGKQFDIRVINRLRETSGTGRSEFIAKEVLWILGCILTLPPNSNFWGMPGVELSSTRLTVYKIDEEK